MSLESGHHHLSIYGADSTLLRPWKLLREMWRDLIASRQLAMILAVRDISAQYRQSLFGIFWILAPPIVVAVGLSVAKENKLINLGETHIPVMAFTLIGMSIWQIFAASISGPLSALGSYRSVLTKVVVPPEAVVTSGIIKLGITVVLQLLLIFFTILWFRLPLSATTLLALPALVGVVMFGTAVGLLLTPIGLLYRDVALALPIFEKGWLLVTPVLYAQTELARGGLFRMTVELNPAGPLIVTTRQLLTGQHLTSLPQFFAVIALAAVMFVGGLIVVRVAMPLVIERWSA